MTRYRLLISESQCFLIQGTRVQALNPDQLPAGKLSLDGKPVELITDYAAEDVFTETLPANLKAVQRRQVRRACLLRLRELYPEALLSVSAVSGAHLLCCVLEPDTRLRTVLGWLSERECRLARVVGLGRLPLAASLSAGDLLHLDRYDSRYCRFRLYRDGELIHQRAVPLSEDIPWAEICTSLRETIAYFRESGVMSASQPRLLYTGPVRGGSALLTHLRQRYSMTVHRLGDLPEYLATLPPSRVRTARYQLPPRWREQQSAFYLRAYVPGFALASSGVLFLFLLTSVRHYQLTADAYALWQREPVAQSAGQVSQSAIDPAALSQYWQSHEAAAARTLVMQLGQLIAGHSNLTLNRLRWQRGLDGAPNALQADISYLSDSSQSALVTRSNIQAWLSMRFDGTVEMHGDEAASRKLNGSLGELVRNQNVPARQSLTLVLEQTDDT